MIEKPGGDMQNRSRTFHALSSHQNVDIFLGTVSAKKMGEERHLLASSFPHLLSQPPLATA
jgi:hypothetical protein